MIGVAAAGIGSFLDVRRAHSDRSLLEARAQARRLRRELQYLQAAAAEAEQDDPELPGDLGAGTEEWEIDPVSGLLRERHLPGAAAAGGGRRPPEGPAGLGGVLGGRRPRIGAGRRARPGRHRPRRGGVAHAARERRAVPHRRRRRGRGARRHRRARCVDRRRAGPRAVALEPDRRLAHGVGRHRVLPHPRARCRGAGVTRGARARRGARRVDTPATTSRLRQPNSSAISRAYFAAMPAPLQLHRRRELVRVGQPLVGQQHPLPDLLGMGETLVGVVDFTADLGQHHGVAREGVERGLGHAVGRGPRTARRRDPARGAPR